MTKPLMLVVALSASVLSAAEPAGRYVLEGVMEVGSELLLKPDGKFEYMLSYGAADYSASGTWRLDGDAVVLNSAGVAGPPFRLVRSAATKADEVRVSVQAPNGRGVERIEVVLQTSGGELRGKDGFEGHGCVSRRTRGAVRDPTGSCVSIGSRTVRVERPSTMTSRSRSMAMPSPACSSRTSDCRLTGSFSNCGIGIRIGRCGTGGTDRRTSRLCRHSQA